MERYCNVFFGSFLFVFIVFPIAKNASGQLSSNGITLKPIPNDIYLLIGNRRANWKTFCGARQKSVLSEGGSVESNHW